MKIKSNAQRTKLINLGKLILIFGALAAIIIANPFATQAQSPAPEELQTFLDYPPMQKGASFNLDAVKAEMGKKMEQAQAASKGPSQ